MRTRTLLLALAAAAVATPAAADDWELDTPLSQADASYWGEAMDDEAGHRVAGAGDVDGDGFDDLLIGVPLSDEAATDAGQAYLVLGRELGWALDVGLGSADGSFLGEASGDLAGHAVAGVGDLDGDGFDDLAIGAYANDEGGADAGQLYLMFGNVGGFGSDLDLAAADASYLGEVDGDEAGYAVAGAGDLDGDGLDDLLVTALGSANGGYAGEVYVVFGRPAGWLPDMDLGTADGSYRGEATQDYAGHSIAAAGDVDGDGLDDLLIGAYGNDENGSSAGQAYLVLGRPAGWALGTGLGSADASFLGELAGDRAGHSVAGAGDVDGDGLDDLLIGAYGNDEGATSAGQTYLVLGRNTGWAMDTDLATADASLLGEYANDLSGSPVAGAGDVDGDGLGDLLIGAFGNDEAGSYAGQTYLWMGDAGLWPPDTPLGSAAASFLGEQADDYSGWSVTGAGDLNADGYDDLAIGARRSSEAAGAAGQVYVVFGQPYCVDGDGDGFGAPGVFTCPGGSDDDCDDADPAINPGVDELCDTIDNDCDGVVDEDDAIDASTWYLDADGDGFGDPSAPANACQAPIDHVADASDCDDTDAAINPGVDELCDGVDNDCDGTVDENDAADASTWYLDGDGDGFGNVAVWLVQCAQPPGYVLDSSDCSDGDASIYPGADEVCDGADHDCDGTVYEDDSIDAPIWYADDDGDGFGDPLVSATACFQPGGYRADATDCDDTDGATYPGAPETCDGDDDDCDGIVDENDAVDAPTWYLDGDSDGYGDPAWTAVACDQPPGYVADATDCDDGNPWRSPGQPELCDGADNDCDGQPGADEVDADGDGWMACGGDCDDADATIYPGASEVHDGADNDCDGLVDDGVLPTGALVITEVMNDPSAVADFDGEWFEVYNTTWLPLNLAGMFVHDDGFNSFTVDTDVWIDPYSYAVLGSNGDELTNGGVVIDHAYSIGNFHLANGDDAIIIEHDGVEIDAIEYDPGFYWPDPSGASLSLDPGAIDIAFNDFGTNWCETHRWPDYELPAGDFGTPGEPNPSCCPDWDGDGYTDAGCGGLDCDDADPGVYPGAAEVCDGWPDNDCDGVLDTDETDEDVDGYSVCEGDCDDADPSTYPGAPELCDGDDNDCDGYNDEGTLYDWDGDGLTACQGDCDDTDGNVYPGAPVELCDGKDTDCDGFLLPGETDADQDGALVCGGDCDDTDPTIYAGAPELCDGIDNNCDGTVPADEGDGDGDGYAACEGDCDDADPARSPGASEACNGIDDDCDGLLDPGEADVDGDGWRICDGDCDDSEPLANPGNAEVSCDGFDNDCDPATADAVDADGDGYDSCSDCDDGDAALQWDDLDLDGASTCEGDCDDLDPDVTPGADEVCDGLDNDCDPATDELGDLDGDGMSICDGDCDDLDADVLPGADEVCDGVDNDCDPLTDEEGDGDGDGATICDGDCDDDDAQFYPGAAEYCDGLDTDCDGATLPSEVDDDGDGAMVCDGDCDDTRADIYPGAPEQCDGLDNDCDGVVDEGVGVDNDGDGVTACQGDCDDADPAVFPGAVEVCDGVDTDCDGVLPPDEADDDGDGWPLCMGDCDDGDASLELDDLDGDGFTTCDGDCDDTRPQVQPGHAEACDGLDNDCNGAVDDRDQDGDGAIAEPCGGGDCNDADPFVNPDAAEVCDDHVDNDCDGDTDEDDDECGGDDDDDTTDDDDDTTDDDDDDTTDDDDDDTTDDDDDDDDDDTTGGGDDDDDDTATLDDDDAPGSCDCQNDLTGGERTARPLLLVALLALVVRRRVRRPGRR